MIYPQRDNKRKKRRTVLTSALLGGFIVLVILLDFFFPHALSPLMHAVGVPFLESGTYIKNGFDDIGGQFSSKQKLISENQTLTEKLAESQAVGAERDFYEQEYRELEGIASTSSVPVGVYAAITSKPGFSPYDTLVIDRGTSDGIAAGDLVLADGTVLLGTVSNAYAHSANVILFSSPGQQTNVMIGAKAIEAVAAGDGGGNFELKLPQNSGIAENDMVSAANYPDKLLGVIDSITTNAEDSFEHVLFRSPVDISELKYVIVEHQQK